MPDDDTTTTPDAGREAQAANLFDLRRIIGGLFLLYGVILTVVGLVDSDAEIARAAGVHINLIAGLGMLRARRPVRRVGARAPARAGAGPRGLTQRRIDVGRAVFNRAVRALAVSVLLLACLAPAAGAEIHVLPPDPAYGPAAGAPTACAAASAPGARAAATGPTVPAVLDRLAAKGALSPADHDRFRALYSDAVATRAKLGEHAEGRARRGHPHARRLRARRRADRLARAGAVPAAAAQHRVLAHGQAPDRAAAAGEASARVRARPASAARG